MRVHVLMATLAAVCLSYVARLEAQTAATFGQVVKLGATPSDIVLDESRHQIYLVVTAGNRVDIFNTVTNTVTGSIYVGAGPLAAAISPDRQYLYVTNGASKTVSVVNLSTNGIDQTIGMSAQPQGVAVGGDGAALISTLDPTNTLVRFDSSQIAANQLTFVPTAPPPSAPTPAPSTTITVPVTSFLSKLATTPDGNYIVGIASPTATTTYLFVYEVSSGSILRSRTVAGQSTVLAIAPDGSRFMAGYTLYDTATLSILGQMNNANAPFPFPATFSTVQNIGGSFFSPDGKTLYGAFNVAASTNPPPPVNSSTLLLSDPGNLAIRLGIVMPENIVAKMVVTADGSNAWSLSQSGLIYLPLSTLYTHPIISLSSTQAFLTTNPCNPGLAQATISVSNLGTGKLTYAVKTISSALTTSVSSGVAPATMTFTMEPGRLINVNRLAGTNLASITTPGVSLLGQSLDVTLASAEAINIPPVIRVYMNYRNPDQRGVIFPVPTTPNNSPIATLITAAANTANPAGGSLTVDGDQGLQDIVLDQTRKRVYLSNAGYNRVEIFDTVNQVFLAPIPVGQLPGPMAISTDGNTLYVASTGGELISIVDLTLDLVTGHVNFPPIPRQAGAITAPIIYPQALSVGLYGLEFVMSNGGQWKVVGNNAVPRLIDNVTTTSTTSNALSVTATTRVNMVSSPDNRYILTLGGNNGTAYLYDASADAYVASSFLIANPIQGLYGPISAGPSQTYFTIDGLFTNSSLTTLPAQTLQRNIIATTPWDANNFVRFTTPIRTTTVLTTVPATDPRPTLELVNIATGSPSLLAVAPENPRFTLFSTTTRYNLPARSMVIDQNNVAYIITVSGLSVVPLTPNGAPAPQIAAKNGILNATDGAATLRVGSFVNVNGTNLATTATASTLPTPTVLGGSCVTFNDVALPLLKTSTGQIVAQIPTTVNTGTNVVQVRSLGTAQQSSPVVVTVQPPAGGTATPPSVVDTINNNRIHQE